jgi:phage shock protein A
MAFTVQDFHDLVTLVTQHPEWRAELRRLVLTEELLALPQIVHDLVEAQQRTEQQIAQLVGAQQHTEQQIAQLIPQVAQLTQQVAQLIPQVAQLTQQVAQLIPQVAQLTQQVAQLTQQVAQLTEGQLRAERHIVRLQDDVGELKGIVLEQRYRNRAFAYFSRLLRRMHTVTDEELVALLEEAVARGALSEDGMDEIARADVVVRGQRRESPGEVYLVVEVSWGVGPGDVERAVRRAALLGQTGLQTMPVVAGERITDEAVELARAMQVWQVLDGRVTAPTPHGH